MAEMETLLDAGQVAKLLGLSIATIRKWVLIRFIPYQKLGRSVRFSANEIQEWAKSRSVKPVDRLEMPMGAHRNEGEKE